MTMKEYEDRMLSLPEARSISGEHDEHKPGDPDFVWCVELDLSRKCMCKRCKIIRIKKRKTRLFPRFKCADCGDLFGPSIYKFCDKCMKARDY